jgi:hypothetical protein
VPRQCNLYGQRTFLDIVSLGLMKENIYLKSENTFCYFRQYLAGSITVNNCSHHSISNVKTSMTRRTDENLEGCTRYSVTQVKPGSERLTKQKHRQLSQ